MNNRIFYARIAQFMCASMGFFVAIWANQQASHPLGWFILAGLLLAITAAIQDCIEEDRKSNDYKGEKRPNGLD